MSTHEPRHLALAQEWLGCERVERLTRSLAVDGVVIGGNVEVGCATHTPAVWFERQEAWPCPHARDLAIHLARFEAQVRADECGVLSGSMMLGLEGDDDVIDAAVEIVEERAAEHRARAES